LTWAYRGEKGSKKEVETKKRHRINEVLSIILVLLVLLLWWLF